MKEKFILFILFIFMCIKTNAIENINIDILIESLIHVESNGNEKAISKDGNCIGVLQIKKIVVDDCNDYLTMKKKNNRFTYDDRYNKEKSIEMFYLIQERYKNYKTERSKTYIEHMIRLWNGGCGYNLINTQKYYDKVMSIYTKKQGQ